MAGTMKREKKREMTNRIEIAQHQHSWKTMQGTSMLCLIDARV